jgi:prephenate dehydrogenase
LAGCGLVVVAVPPRHIPTVFAAVRRHAPATATVTDTASIKCAVADAARQLFGTDSGRIIGAHPMAGSEQTGANAARADLLPGQTCVLTESPGDAPTSRALVRALWQDWLGMRVVVMTPEAHDAAVASVSHLPHLTSSALVCAASALGGLELAAGGFRDTTRIAAGDPSLWTDIALHNAAALDTALAELQSRLAALRLALHQRDSHTLRQLLEAGRDNRLAWEASQADPRNVPSPPRPAARD